MTKPALEVYDEATIRRVAGLDHAALRAVFNGLLALEAGRAIMPPILRLDVPEREAEMDVKTAYVEGLPIFALKVSTGFFGNAALGLPSLGGLMVAIDAETGRPRAILADNGYLTDLRTALAGALAADVGARPDARTVAVFGTGLQARLQVRALRLVRPIERVLVWGRDPLKAEAAARDIAEQCGIAAETIAVPAAACAADIVVTATASTAPILSAASLRPGQHVTAVGADAPHKGELAASVLKSASVVLVDASVQSRSCGELHHAARQGLHVPDNRVMTLGRALGGEPARRTDDDLVVCDLTGTGVQDTAIACFVLERLAQAGA